MTSCKGIHGIKAVDLGSDPDPFFGILGVKHGLTFTEALSLNDRIYRLWFSGTALTGHGNGAVEPRRVESHLRLELPCARRGSPLISRTLGSRINL